MRPARPVPGPDQASTRPLDEEGEALPADDPDTVAQTRPLPEPEARELHRHRPESLPTIGHIGRYALKYRIGEGGLGTVYAAHDPLLSRLIAIKTLNVELPQEDREQFNALFLNEAKAAGSLNHPHIVTVYDAGVSPQGPYIAMELLRGKDLRQLLALGWRPTPAQAALIVRRVADALSYAHHRGVVHRDIKPANIFMVGRTQPRVLDFGIARIRQAESLSRDDEQSRFQEVVGGSPYYMAPEQVRHEPVDRRADVYSLGVVLYELLTGRKPFNGSHLEEIADAVLRGEAPPPWEVDPEVPKVLSDIAMQAMSRDVEQRTRSARALSQALRAWLSEQGDLPEPGRASGRGPGHVGEGRRTPRSWIWGVAVAGWVLALAGVAWTIWQSHQDDGSITASAEPAHASSAATGSRPSASGATAQASAQSEIVEFEESPNRAVLAGGATADKTGTVQLAISPWGEVFEGDRSLGVTPPLNQVVLPSGRHVLTIRNGDAAPVRKTVEVKAGDTVVVEHQF